MKNRDLVEALCDLPADCEVVLGVMQNVGIKGAHYSPKFGTVCLGVEDRTHNFDLPPDEEEKPDDQ